MSALAAVIAWYADRSPDCEHLESARGELAKLQATEAASVELLDDLTPRVDKLDTALAQMIAERDSLIPLAKLGLWILDYAALNDAFEREMQEQAMECGVIDDDDIGNDTEATIAARALLEGEMKLSMIQQAKILNELSEVIVTLSCAGWCASMRRAEVKDGIFLRCLCGFGPTPEHAMDHLFDKARGASTVVKDAGYPERREYRLVGYDWLELSAPATIATEEK